MSNIADTNGLEAPGRADEFCRVAASFFRLQPVTQIVGMSIDNPNEATAASIEILHVDDDPALLDLTESFLENELGAVVGQLTGRFRADAAGGAEKEIDGRIRSHGRTGVA